MTARSTKVVPALVLLGLVAAGPALAYHKIIVIDKSGSMRQPDVEGSSLSRYEKAKSMVLEEVAFDFASGRNRVTILFFDHNVYSFLSCRTLAEARLALDSHPPKGDTNIGDTLVAMLNAIVQDSDETYFAISLYTDGEEKLSVPTDQKISIPKARQALVDFFGARNRRLFVSIYHHRWNSQANKDFAELLTSVAREVRHNEKVTIWIEENPDPTKRVRFVGVFPSVATEKVFVERPREGVVVEMDVVARVEATDLAVENKLVFRVVPTWKGPDGVSLKFDGGSEFPIEKANAEKRFRLVLHGLDKVVDEKDYEIVLGFELDENRTDDLFLQKIESKEYVMRLVPPELYLDFRVSPTPFFTLVSPKDGKVEASARAGRTVYHPVRLAWNGAARGQRVEWKWSGAPGAVRLVDAARQDVPASFELASGTGEGAGEYYLAATLKDTTPLAGKLTLSGTGKVSAIQASIHVRVEPRVGTARISFPDREQKKVFPGQALVSPLSIHVQADADAVGEKFRIAARAQDGVTIQILDNFGRDVGGKLQSIDDAGLLPFGISLLVEAGTDAKTFDPAANRIEFLPEHPGRLAFVDAAGEPATEYPFPFAIVAPERDFEVDRPGEAGTVLVKSGSDGVEGKLRVVWTQDANRAPFDMKVRLSIQSPTGQPTAGLEFVVDGSAEASRTRSIGGSQPPKWELPWKARTTRPGEWVVEVEFEAPSLGLTRSVKVPVRSVIGQVRVHPEIATTRAVGPATRTAIGRIDLEAVNRYAAGEAIDFEIESQEGVEIRLLDPEGNPIAGNSMPAPNWEGARTGCDVQVLVSYDALSAPIDPAANRIRFTPRGRSLEVAGPRDDRGIVTVVLAWTHDRPVLTHRVGEMDSKEVELGSWLPSSGLDFAGEPAMTLEIAAPEAVRARVRAETVRLEWKEWDRTSLVESVVFAATGKPEATVAELEKDARFRITFQEGVEQGLLTDQRTIVEVTLLSDGPVRFETADLALGVLVPSRLTATASLLLVIGLVVVGYLVVSRLGGSGAETLAGGLARPGADPIRLDGFQAAYLVVAGDRLSVSPDKSPDAWARIVSRKGKVYVEPMSGSVEVDGRPVEGRAEVVDGSALALGPVQATWVRRAEEKALDEVNLSPSARPRRAEDDEVGIDLGPPGKAKAPAPAAAQEPAAPAASKADDLPPPPPEDDDEEGIQL